MLLVGIIAFAAIVIMILKYRVPGFVASIALLGQIAGMLASHKRLFGGVDSFTLTIPGIAGIILAVGMGVDANVLTSEFIRDEPVITRKRWTCAIDAGYAHAFFRQSSTVTLQTLSLSHTSLWGVFGPSDGLWAKILSDSLALQPHRRSYPGLAVNNSITGSIYLRLHSAHRCYIQLCHGCVFASALCFKGISLL